MRLIIGGAYQGKLEYAKKTYGIEEGWIDGRSCGWMEIAGCCGIHHFHEYVKRMILAEPETGADGGTQIFQFCTEDLTLLEEQAQEFSAWLFQVNPELTIVSNELGYGIVPMEKEDRLWREAVGRICTSLAAKADEVVRVICGMGMRLK
ncbi:MAG: bifunctional adenosylcobinamide kinase/adenosylcobinamide-phosphate guanylyltransferase [Lachnospiraceae bacterium]|nr:bifunctional adenosylcobinamide kinase/adenosylcobinamide-phosphate guanylyltransferase [Lachnospiraceae bacterium]